MKLDNYDTVLNEQWFLILVLGPVVSCKCVIMKYITKEYQCLRLWWVFLKVQFNWKGLIFSFKAQWESWGCRSASAPITVHCRCLATAVDGQCRVVGRIYHRASYICAALFGYTLFWIIMLFCCCTCTEAMLCCFVYCINGQPLCCSAISVRPIAEPIASGEHLVFPFLL